MLLIPKQRCQIDLAKFVNDCTRNEKWLFLQTETTENIISVTQKMSNQNTVKHWSEEDQPRERLKNKGGRALSTAELIAILFRTGCEGQNVVELSRELLNATDGSLYRLSQLDVPTLMKFKGVGEAKAITLHAALELGHRLSAERVEQRTGIIKNSKDLYFEFVNDLGNLNREEFWAIYLNQRNKPLYKCRLAQGGLSDVAVDMRMLFEPAISYKATTIAVAHNHPTMNVHPSKMDDDLTSAIQKAGDLLRIKLLDHIIIGSTPTSKYGLENTSNYDEVSDNETTYYYSYADEGRL